MYIIPFKICSAGVDERGNSLILPNYGGVG